MRVLVRNLGWLVSHSLEGLMASVEQFAAAIAALDAATNEVAEEVARLRALLEAGGLSAAQEAEVLASLGAIEVKLRALGSEPV